MDAFRTKGLHFVPSNSFEQLTNARFHRDSELSMTGSGRKPMKSARIDAMAFHGILESIHFFK